MEKYVKQILNMGANCCKVIDSASVVTAPWTIFKCQFGCPNYGRSYCCPPKTYDHKTMGEMLDSYHRGILFGTHDMPMVGEIILAMNRQLFHDGLFKVIYFGSGPCRICGTCPEGGCRFPAKAIPSMEACGIDVYTTVLNNGFFIKTLKEQGEQYNCYGLILVD